MLALRVGTFALRATNWKLAREQMRIFISPNKRGHSNERLHLCFPRPHILVLVVGLSGQMHCSSVISHTTDRPKLSFAYQMLCSFVCFSPSSVVHWPRRRRRRRPKRTTIDADICALLHWSALSIGPSTFCWLFVVLFWCSFEPIW